MKSHELTPSLALYQKANHARGNLANACKRRATAVSETARATLLSLRREPFLKVRWEPVLFFHFKIEPQVLAAIVPSMFELEQFDGMACLSLAVVHMSGFRSCRLCSRGLLVQALREQRFLNLRTYARHGAERGVLFLHGWLSRPDLLPLPAKIFGLPYRFARFAAQRQDDALMGSVVGRGNCGAFSYRVDAPANRTVAPCPPGSAAEFAMEQYSGFFARRNRGYVFRVWHPPWEQAPVKAQFNNTSLVTNLFPWFGTATFAGAHLTEPIDEVWLSRAYHLPAAWSTSGNHRVLSGFYDMP